LEEALSLQQTAGIISCDITWLFWQQFSLGTSGLTLQWVQATTRNEVAWLGQIVQRDSQYHGRYSCIRNTWLQCSHVLEVIAFTSSGCSRVNWPDSTMTNWANLICICLLSVVLWIWICLLQLLEQYCVNV
jgi:hypothetical protein